MKYLFLSLLFVSSICFGQVIQWVQGTGGVSLAVDNLNSVYIVSYDYNPAGDIYLTKEVQTEVFFGNQSMTRLTTVNGKKQRG